MILSQGKEGDFLLENVVTLFKIVRSLSYAKGIKEKHKIESNKSKSLSLQRKIKKPSLRHYV